MKVRNRVGACRLSDVIENVGEEEPLRDFGGLRDSPGTELGSKHLCRHLVLCLKCSDASLDGHNFAVRLDTTSSQASKRGFSFPVRQSIQAGE